VSPVYGEKKDIAKIPTVRIIAIVIRDGLWRTTLVIKYVMIIDKKIKNIFCILDINYNFNLIFFFHNLEKTIGKKNNTYLHWLKVSYYKIIIYNNCSLISNYQSRPRSWNYNFVF
jgi:hypothetical protein